MEITWQIKHFSALTLNELYEAMALRQTVFIVEQQCPYLDADGKDAAAWHVLGRDIGGRLVAYSRLLAPGISYPAAASIGRVATHPAVRGTGSGRELMRHSIAAVSDLFPGAPLSIGAQYYLLNFYRSFGFAQEGDIYDEDGIPHIMMSYER